MRPGGQRLERHFGSDAGNIAQRDANAADHFMWRIRVKTGALAAR
jgi:hypothetical protein